MDGEAVTWHHGLVARWWAEFNRDGDDISYFQRVIERSGEPALDLACGSGRLLVPFLRAGLDVDGCDVSEDMLAHCAALAESGGLDARLERQSMGALDLPRRYKTVVICGSFGIGGTRADDREALRRGHRHLEPGGTLAFDLYLPNFEKRSWGAWLPEGRPSLPTAWPEHGDRKQCADGTELELKKRVLEFDPLDQVVRRELRAEHWVDGELVAAEESALSINIYFKSEVVLMLEGAGFGEIRVTGGLDDREAQPYQDERVVFAANAV